MAGPEILYLSAAEIRNAKSLRATYQAATAQVGRIHPWEVLGSVHYRENDFLTSCAVPGGVFQLDPGGEGPDLRKRIDDYVGKVFRRYGLPTPEPGRIEHDFQTAALVAAHELKEKAQGISRIRKDGTIDEAAIALDLLRYNGLGYMVEEGPEPGAAGPVIRYRFYSERGQTGRGSLESDPAWSPYVSSDPKRGRILKMRATMPDPKDPSKRIKVFREDPRPGALVVFRELRSRAAELA